MSTKLALLVADFETQLATQIDEGGTGGTLQSYADDDGVNLPDGTYFFTLDKDNSQKEHIVCTLTAGVMSAIKSVSRQGVQTSGTLRKHRIGASVTITDFAHIMYMNDLLRGATLFNSAVKLGYDGNPSITSLDLDYFATVRYVNGVAIAGAPDATVLQKGIVFMSTAPASPTSPIAVGDNDSRMLTQGENDAAQGTSGSPSNTNRFVTDQDTSAPKVANKVVRYGSNADLGATRIDVTYPLGEAFTGATTPQPAVVIDDLLQPLFDGISQFGAAASPQHAVKIIPRQNTTVSSLITMLMRTTDPSTNLSVEIQSDNAGAPSNSAITNGTSATIATSTLKNNEYRYFNFTFATPPALVAGTTYWIVFKTSATNANQISIPTLTNAKKYASFSGSTYNGSAWSANQPIPYFEIICATGGSKSLWVADGNGVEPLGNWHGFCVTTGSAGDTGTLARQGIVEGFSSLAVNSDYYLSNTAGTLTLNKDEGVFVGTAISASRLLVPASKLSQRNTNYYLTLAITGEAGSAWYSVPYYAYEDGVFTIYGTASVKNSTRTTLNCALLKSYANATSPSASSGDVVGAIQTYDSSADGPGVMVVPVRKGDRIQVSQGNAGGAGNAPSLSKVTFIPTT